MHGLYLLYWVQEKHMSAAIVAAILAAGDLALVALEIPTGWFADRFGHRASLIAGSLTQVVGMVCCWLGQGTPGLMAASLLVALGDGFRSGADQALLYRSCVALEREDAFQRIEATTRAVGLAAMVGLIVAGGAIVKAWGFAIGWVTETALCAAGLAIACAMAEPPVRIDEAWSDGSTAERTDASALSLMLSPTQRSSGVGTMAGLILPAAFLGGAAAAASFLVQTAGGIDPQRMTAVVALITLAEAAGSAVAVRLPVAGLRGQAIMATIGAVGMATALVFSAAFLPVVVALAFLVGVAHPLRAVAIQRLAKDSVRARAASVASAIDMAFNTIALALAGFLRRQR
jgi:MFS family permease